MIGGPSEQPSPLLAEREAELLPVPYFHVVFTLPAPVADIAYQNKAVIYEPGLSVPCSWVGGFSSAKTCSVFRLGNFSSPSLRRNNALRPSPTKIMASWGIAS